mgnify:CR=1 FL=1
MANFGDMEVKLTEESIAALNEFSASLNKFSEAAEKCVVAFQEFQSAQQSVQRMCLWERLKCWWLAQIAHR